MKNKLNNIKNFLLLTAMPLLYGCGGGGSGGAISQLGSLFGGSSSSSLAGGGSGGGLASLGSSIAQVQHNPEPATMILMGSGLAFMAYYRKSQQ